ncbi:hypothetical protein [Paraconexibacter sp.]|uniref:hypothetical protein n=1 Tax=Paraconexibacter sp. TaxID=2949640 RepID=UPI00356423E9
MTASKPASLRLVQGVILLAGALVLATAVDRATLSFFWTPLVLGLTYLVAAAAGGREGGYWATALPLTGWGLAVVWIGEVRPEDVDIAGAYLAGTGLGLTAAAVLASRGVPIATAGLAATVAAAGLILAFSPRADALTDATTYAIAVGAVGAVNVARGLLGR